MARRCRPLAPLWSRMLSEEDQGKDVDMWRDVLNFRTTDTAETRERHSDPGKVQVSPGLRGRRFVRGVGEHQGRESRSSRKEALCTGSTGVQKTKG